MAAPQHDSSSPSQTTPIWSTVKCDTRFCKNCEKVPFNDEIFRGQSGMSEPGWEGLQIKEHGLVSIGLGELVDYWPELAVLDESAKNCDFCKLIQIQLMKATFSTKFERGRLRIDLSYRFRKDNGNGGLSLSNLLAEVVGEVEDGDEIVESTTLVYLRFTLDAVEGKCRRWLHLEQTPPSEFLSGENISKITARLKKSHKKSANFLPTRLLDLTCHGKSSMFLRLVTKEEAYSEHHTVPMYVALSYTWGPPEESKLQTKTTPENLPDRMANINLQTLSKVIQDAVTVCKVFGVRYLWVDALCIVQGDSQDWERESANMGNIFRNAYFTIGTASIRSCNESFLSQTVDTLEIPFVSHIDPGVRGTYRLTARPSEYFSHIFENCYEDRQGPWDERGWVFQETALSPRLLIFGSTIVHMELEEELHAKSMEFFHLDEETLCHAGWRRLVMNYSPPVLTYKQDVFPAISGLARLYEKRLEDQYLAGIWRKDLHISLFFDTYDAHPSKRKSFSQRINEMESRRPYVAPSWSWAAHDRYIELGSFGYYRPPTEYNATSECNVVDALCVVEGLDRFGIVVHGYIVLAGKMLRPKKNEFSLVPVTRWEENRAGYYDWCLEDQSPIMLVYLDGVLDGENDRYDDLVFFLLGSHDNDGEFHDGEFQDRDKFMARSSDDDYSSQERDDSIQESQTSKDGSECQCLEQASWQSSKSMSGGGVEESPEEERATYGLVLYPAKGTNKFYRIGSFMSEVRKQKLCGGMRFCENWGVETVEII